ncbi:MAG TPA: transglutaminase-like domain-containing protein [Verrucomicrobiae bacterium]|nr:transglutaminase-like domain-containing protein [Verrucomicrobiae bacterium]
MKQALLVLSLVLAMAGGLCFAQEDVIKKAGRLELQGHFSAAAEILKASLADAALGAAEQKQLEFELDRLARIKKDFPYTKDQLFAVLKKSVRDLTLKEFDDWIREGRFDSRQIDGQVYFMGSSVKNLFFRYPELESRRVPPKDTTVSQKARLETCLAIQRAAIAEKKPYVLPKRFHITLNVTAKANAAPAGQIIRAWLPIPREYPFQRDFDLLSASPKPARIDARESAIRSIFMGQPARKDRPTEFRIEYDYTCYGVSFAPKPELVKASNPNDPLLSPFTREGPHLVFTPELRKLSTQIVGGETNPCLVAKRCYDWIATHIQYSLAIEYSTIRNISDYCRTKGYGDCGQEAMLFIALCRLNGIPARWQSGWNTFPGNEDIHDWSEIYLAPYGWVPVDPYMGIFAMQYATALSAVQRREIRDFYFGGLDQYRMAANSDHCQTLVPPKQSMRSDNVDFQRGELEWGSHNIYFDQYSYEFDVKELPLPKGTVD